jgi:hypothetical protein
MSLYEATPDEMTQLINKFWSTNFNISDPTNSNIKRVVIDNPMIQLTDTNGKHYYQAYKSFSSIPNAGTPYWLYNLFNPTYFDLIVNVNDIDPENAVHHIQEIDIAADNLIQTKW